MAWLSDNGIVLGLGLAMLFWLISAAVKRTAWRHLEQTRAGEREKSAASKKNPPDP